MASVVGLKGQIIIDRDIRDRLGIRPGWKAVQRVVGNHVELHFVPPSHHRAQGDRPDALHEDPNQALETEYGDYYEEEAQV
jgi:bifunctional DNA-binding transcriptional regulator/antitoxin component of YhaV-PrlF toxin-antitoxin module